MPVGQGSAATGAAVGRAHGLAGAADSAGGPRKLTVADVLRTRPSIWRGAASECRSKSVACWHNSPPVARRRWAATRGSATRAARCEPTTTRAATGTARPAAARAKWLERVRADLARRWISARFASTSRSSCGSCGSVCTTWKYGTGSRTRRRRQHRLRLGEPRTLLDRKQIQRTHRPLQVRTTHVQINQRGRERTVPQQPRDRQQVHARFHQPRRVTVPQRLLTLLIRRLR